MCGVFGFVGTEQNVPQTVGVALKSLEYRGYDSWGIVWRDAGRLKTVKKTGKVPTSFTFDAISRIAVGHTRWATHGGVTEANAHPHLDSSGRVAIVHNGIIENASELRLLLDPLVNFASQTDSEVVAHLLGVEVRRGRNITEALRRVFPLLQGQNAIVAIDQETEVIAAAMNVSPLVIGVGDGGTCIASDPFALAGRATTMIVAPRDAIIELTPIGVRAFNFDGSALPIPDQHPVPDVTADELGGYSSFMAKEMADQSAVLTWQADDLTSVGALANGIRHASTIIFVGCGSAYFAARLGAGWLGAIAGKPALAIQASELADHAAFLGTSTLVCAVTQSGETADVLEAMEIAKSFGSRVMALTNVEHSSAARLAESVIPLGAGRERSVLATKSMTAMLGRLLATACLIAPDSDSPAEMLRTTADMVTTILHDARIESFLVQAVPVIGASQHAFVIGKGDGFGVAQEAALKIKESSYIHAEAFAAGELKHGAIALIEPGSPCLLFTTHHRHIRDTASAAQEVRSRGGYTIGVGPGFDSVTDLSLSLDLDGPSLAIAEIVVAQSLALRLAIHRKLDPDFPRNLAKSVTVK
ncbi:MAG TPA: glutamine--fructose-6-phosphate transaminase (isomerizing) [Thermomicrobiales bacterium]|nr:glutamine--fructose-6-phosphate transaminase (isomerizing) [Thermomicrobiales bacterium]